MKRLSTCENLLKVNVQVDLVRNLCRQEDETLNHLFFRCDFSARVWHEVMKWCGVTRSSLDWVLKL